MITRNIYNKALVIMVSCLLCCSNALAATQITATLVHTGSTYYMNGETYKQTYDNDEERYAGSAGQRGWNGQAAMKFSFDLPAGKTVISATLTWSAKLYKQNNGGIRNNNFYYLNLGKDIDWNAFAQGRGNMIAAMQGKPYTYFNNVELQDGREYFNLETDVTTAVKAVESQGYITMFLTNCPSSADLYGKGSNSAPSLSITYADKRTVTFVAGDDATCATTSLSCASEGSVTSVTLPVATDNNGAEFRGWYTAPIGGTRIGGAGDTYEPSSDITLYAQYDRMPTAITVAGESTIKYGTTTTLTATLSPSNTVNSGIQWFSGNADIATVDQNGVVTATGLGSVYITARATADSENIRDVFQLTVESDHYAYTVNAVDGNGNVLKEIKTGTYATGTGQLAIPVPRYVLSGTTLYETAQGPSQSGNYYTYLITPNTDGYVANLSYTNSTVNNVVFYTEAEQCSALTQKVIDAITYTKASNDTTARNTAYGVVTTLVPGTYKIYTRAINSNSKTFTYKFKVGDDEVMSEDVVQGYHDGTSESFTITETKTLSVYCPAGNNGGLDYFYIVQDPVYHVTSNLQQFNFTKENIDGTVYTTANPVNSKGSNGTHNGVTGAFYNIKWESNYVTITVEGAIAFSIDAFHGNSKETRGMHVYVDGTESVEFNITPGDHTTSPIITLGNTGTHTIKVTGDGKDVYPADIVFYTQAVTPMLNYTNAAVKVGETQELTLRLPHGCTFSGMTDSGNANKVTASFVRDDSSDSQGRKGTLTLTGLETTGNTPTSLKFGIVSSDESVYLSGTATITVDVLKSTLILSYSDGGTGDDATEYVCNADESAPALPDIRLTATDEYGNNVSLDDLNITYVSDDHTVANVTNTGVITLTTPYGNGTAVITATATSDDYDDAEAEYKITIQKGVNWKVATHSVFQDTAPGVRDTFHVSKYIGGAEKLYLVGTFGGWNRNNNTYNYPQTNGSTKAVTDHWYGNDTENKKISTSSTSVDGFSKYWSGAADASNETMYSSLEQYYNSVIYGTERFGWFKQPDGNTTYPFTLPVRGAYITLEPEVNGTLSVYIEQNGPWNSNKKDIYDNDGNLVSVNANGTATTFPGTAPFQFRPHAFFIVDQNGHLVDKYASIEMITRKKVTSGIAESGKNATQNTMLDTFCENYACEKGEKFKCILDENADGYNDVTNIGNWKEFKEYMSPGEQQRVYDNWSAGVNGAQVVTKLDNGAYLALDPGMVKYTFHVIAGQTYYIFSNFSKIGFSGVNFVPDDENQPSGTLALSEKVAYDPSSLKRGDAVNTKPMYETITLDRKFTTGKWNTICLPFTMTEKEVETVFGKNTELIILDRVNVDAGHASIFMTYHEIQNILAGYPYLIKPTQDVDHIEVHNKVIDPDQQVLAFSNNGYTSKGTRNFCTADVTNAKGTVNNYSYCLKAGDIFLNSNTLYVSAGNSYLYGYRSYLELEPGATGAKSVSMNYSKAWFDDEEESETTSIAVAEFAPDALEAMGITTTGNGVYNLGGQRVADTLTGLPKGIYIMNGNKVVVE
ncbi:MAG: Ig-like domain-containing protein [Prevotella sp.]|nr:Ig-like domain-containing protein [Prevotella sp.]